LLQKLWCEKVGQRAKAHGVNMGRKPKLTTFQRHEALTRVANGETTRDVARSYDVSHSTISRIPA
jgi:DNA invertase Pin-like site-specific DNA recombinase